MTYKDVLNSLADKTVETYSAYIQSKISGLTDDEGFLTEKTEQHRSEYDRLEKKLVALLAIVKNDDSINAEVPDTFYEEFVK